MNRRPRSPAMPAITAALAFVAAAGLVLLFTGEIVGALVLGAIAAGVGWMIASARAKKAHQADAVSPSPGERPGTARTLQPGDVVGLDERMWIVEGTLRFDEGGFVWHEHVLVDGPDRWWLSVEDDDGALELVRWNRLRGGELAPTSNTITHDGVTYQLDERGSAGFAASGTTGAPEFGRADYADYEAGDKRLGFERYGPDSPWEVSVGVVMSEHDIEIYPGSDAAAGATAR